jgi:hypothetical protein
VKERSFKQQDGFVEQTVGGETILVPLVNSVAQMNEVITLNELGTFIYHLLEEEKSFYDLVEEILKTYDVNKTEAINDLNNFLSNALEKRIIFALN